MRSDDVTPAEIRTGRLLLREVRSTDAKSIEALAGEREVALMTAQIPHPYPKGGASAWIRASSKLVQTGKLSQYALVQSSSDQLIGILSIRYETTDWQRAEIAYWLGKPYWGQGLMPEAVNAAIEWARRHRGLKELWAGVLPHNTRSIRLLRSLGFENSGEFSAFLANQSKRAKLRKLVLKLEDAG